MTGLSDSASWRPCTTMTQGAGEPDGQGAYKNAITACAQNAKRLCDDMGELFEQERYEAAFHLAILSQEESAKAFLLGFINDGIVPWTKEVEHAIRSHECKHLLGLIMWWLNPSMEVVFERMRTWQVAAQVELPREVADAINVLRHEKIGRWISAHWSWEEDPEWDARAVKISKGQVERRKQRAVYADVRDDGTYTLPKVSRAEAETECCRAKQMLEIADSPVMSFNEYHAVRDAMRLVFANLQPGHSEAAQTGTGHG